MPDGSLIFSSLVQPLKASYPISTTESGMMTSRIVSHPSNAYGAMASIPSAITSLSGKGAVGHKIVFVPLCRQRPFSTERKVEDTSFRDRHLLSKRFPSIWVSPLKITLSMDSHPSKALMPICFTLKGCHLPGIHGCGSVHRRFHAPKDGIPRNPSCGRDRIS